MEHVATADLFKRANEAAKAGEPAGDHDLPPHRLRVSRVPVRPGLAVQHRGHLRGRGDLARTIATLRELVKRTPTRASRSTATSISPRSRPTTSSAPTRSRRSRDPRPPEPDLRRPGRGERAQGLHPDRAQAVRRCRHRARAAVAQWRGTTTSTTRTTSRWRATTAARSPTRKFLEAPVRLPDDR